MLPLNLSGITVTNSEEDGPVFTIHAGCAGRPAGCLECGGQNFIGHGQHVQQINDLPHQGKFTCIHLTRKRYRCKDCQTTFFHPLDWVDDDHHATKRFVDRIAALALERSFSDIAREYGINEKTVRNIFYGRYKDDIDTTQFAQPEFMGIDELDICGTGRGVVTNLSNNSAIEFLKDCSSKTFREYFEKMPNRDAVKAVSMDCTKRYKTLIHELFPKAKVVADKFHILKMADDAVDAVRTQVRKECESKRTQLRLKQDKYVLKTREHNLEDWQRKKLDEWREMFPAIGVVYDLKEEFYPITNAYTECQNGLTRAMDRLGRGYSFDALRVKLLRAPKKQGVVTSYRSIKRKLKKPPEFAMQRMVFLCTGLDDDDYETIQVPERKEVTFGVDIARLADWLEEEATGQRRLPGVG